MAEYNLQYLNLKRRLTFLKVLTASDGTLTEEKKNSKLAEYDSLLKLLDDRYSDEKSLGIIETQLNKLEGK